MKSEQVKREGIELLVDTEKFGEGKANLLNRIQLNCIPYLLSDHAEEFLVYGHDVEARSS